MLNFKGEGKYNSEVDLEILGSLMTTIISKKYPFLRGQLIFGSDSEYTVWWHRSYLVSRYIIYDLCFVYRIHSMFIS